MKHTATIPFLALLFLVGPASAQTNLHAYPSVVDFYDTSTPCAYVLTFTKTSGNGVYDTVTVTPSAHTIVSGDSGKTYSLTPIQVLVPQSLLTFPTAPQRVVFVKAVTSTPITLHETIQDTDNAGQSTPESVSGDILSCTPKTGLVA
jgi:hypothetical protein